MKNQNEKLVNARVFKMCFTSKDGKTKSFDDRRNKSSSNKKSTSYEFILFAHRENRKDSLFIESPSLDSLIKTVRRLGLPHREYEIEKKVYYKWESVNNNHFYTEKIKVVI